MVQKAHQAQKNLCTWTDFLVLCAHRPRPLSHPTSEEFSYLQSSSIGQIKPPLALDLRDFCKQIVQSVNQASGNKVHTIQFLVLYVQD